MRRAFLRLLAKEHLHSKLLDEEVTTSLDAHRMVERHRAKTKELERVLLYSNDEHWKLRRADGTLWP